MEDARSALFDQLAVVGKAFGSAKRLELVDLLTQGERTVDSLARETGAGVSTVSAHLQVLKLSSLVHTRKEGTKVYYSLAGDDVAALFAALRELAFRHSADVERALHAYLSVTGDGEVDEVSREELIQLLRTGEVRLIDVRPEPEYMAGHIPGAESVPFGQIDRTIEDLDGVGPIIAYCRGAYCVMASDAVRLLRASGLAARRLQDGLLEWRLAGLPVVPGGG